ncbi:hypothetical protein FCV25MIE_18303 [Fagus crenata]
MGILYEDMMGTDHRWLRRQIQIQPRVPKLGRSRRNSLTPIARVAAKPHNCNAQTTPKVPPFSSITPTQMAQTRVGFGGDKFTTGNHFHEKILKLKDLMKTKKRTERRHKFMEEFLKEFYEEWEERA